MKIDRKLVKTRLYLAFWLILVISFVTAISFQSVRYNEYAKKEKDIMAQIENERLKAEELDKNEAYYKSDAFIEKIARDQLGYIRSDEIIFYTDEK